MNHDEEKHVTDNDVVDLVSHAGSDHLEDYNEGAENGDGMTWCGGLKAVETAFAYIE
jgi:hypothetical protein